MDLLQTRDIKFLDCLKKRKQRVIIEDPPSSGEKSKQMFGNYPF